MSLTILVPASSEYWSVLSAPECRDIKTRPTLSGVLCSDLLQGVLAVPMPIFSACSALPSSTLGLESPEVVVVAVPAGLCKVLAQLTVGQGCAFRQASAQADPAPRGQRRRTCRYPAGWGIVLAVAQSQLGLISCTRLMWKQGGLHRRRRRTLPSCGQLLVGTAVNGIDGIDLRHRCISAAHHFS